MSDNGWKQCEDSIEKCVRHFAMGKNTREPAKFLTVKVSVLWGDSKKRNRFLGIMSGIVLTTL